MERTTYYWPVHWEDGMKLNKGHFLAQQRAQTQELIFATGVHVTPVNYGLLPPVTSEQPVSKLFVSLDNQDRVRIRIQYCRAVTPGGALIHITEPAHTSESADRVFQTPVVDFSGSYQDLKSQADTYFVVLTVQPYDRVPVGEADMNEIPPRLPHTMPRYTLSLLPAEALQGRPPGLYQLVVGKVLLDGQKIWVDEQYLPPCVTTGSHPDLVDIFGGLEQFLSKMELYSVQILQKVYQKKQQNEMADIVKLLCENILQYEAAQAMLFRWTAMHQPPLVMLSQIASLARLIKNTLDQFIGTGKEELMNYLAEWCDVKQADLEGIITELTTHAYNHEDINATVVRVSKFTRLLSHLFHNLSKLDYIGKKRETNIFVKEEVLGGPPASTPVRTRRSFLAE